MTARYKSHYVGCGDYYGENKVDDFLNKTIAEVCAKNNVPTSDYEKIAQAFIAACEAAYSNGADNIECEINDF